jgi:hypothetical protein
MCQHPPLWREDFALLSQQRDKALLGSLRNRFLEFSGIICAFAAGLSRGIDELDLYDLRIAIVRLRRTAHKRKIAVWVCGMLTISISRQTSNLQLVNRSPQPEAGFWIRFLENCWCCGCVLHWQSISEPMKNLLNSSNL